MKKVGFDKAGFYFTKASFLSVFIITTLIIASPVFAETLTEALSKAYLNNPNLLAARAELRAVDEGVSEAQSGWRPTVTLNYDFGKVYTKSNPGSSAGGSQKDRTPRTAELSIEQNLYLGGRTAARTRRAEQDVLAQRARLASVEQDVILTAGTAYVDVRRDKAVLKLNQNNERVLRRQLEATRDRFQVGEVTRTDVAQAESRVSRAKADRIQSEGDLVQSWAAYRDVIGDIPGTLEPAKPLGNLPINQDNAIEHARQNNPQIMRARFVERSAAAHVKVIEGELYPKIDLEGSISRKNDTKSYDSRTDEESITATLTVPLYKAGGVRSRIRAAKQVHSQRRRELDATVRTTIANAIRAWENYQTAVAQINAFNSVVRAASIALDGVKQEAHVGSRSVLDVLDAEQELLDARVNLVRAKRDEVVASFNVRRRIGRLQASQLDLGVPSYDFKAYYKNVRNKWFGIGIGRK